MTKNSAGERRGIPLHFSDLKRPSDFSFRHLSQGPSPELLARADAGWDRFLRAAHKRAAPSGV
ncbi:MULTISPECIES: hypothetical protein [Streptomyces]|uniref:hypothetical protein n=1 Tax=Streptomyces TaxID=1883 RepID=UPI00136E767D|nr:hypothetical protein [Streptomyces sp. SID1046]MYV77110.1 hypothetical protein [Streptomyces sp. SID1046]